MPEKEVLCLAIAPYKTFQKDFPSCLQTIALYSIPANTVSGKSIARYKFPVFLYLPVNAKASGQRLQEINNFIEETCNGQVTL